MYHCMYVYIMCSLTQNMYKTISFSIFQNGDAVTNGTTQASEENTQRQSPTSRTTTVTVTVETEGDDDRCTTRLEVGERIIIDHYKRKKSDNIIHMVSPTAHCLSI